MNIIEVIKVFSYDHARKLAWMGISDGHVGSGKYFIIILIKIIIIIIQY